MDTMTRCKEETFISPNCLRRFDIMDDNISFVKTDLFGKPQYRWCVNCKLANEKRDMEHREQLLKEEEKINKNKDKNETEPKLNFNELINDETFKRKLLEKKDEITEKKILKYEKEEREKEKKREDKIRIENEIIKQQNKNKRILRQEALEPYQDKPFPEFFKGHYDEECEAYIPINCYKCNNYFCFPQDFRSIHEYFNFKIPSNYYHLCNYPSGLRILKDEFPNYCNRCFEKKLEKNKKIYEKYVEKNTHICNCGKDILIQYTKGSNKWKKEIEKHEKTNYIHLLYEKDMDIFCDLREKLGFNLYIKKRSELVEFVENHKIKFKILENMNSNDILEGLIELFKKNGNEFPVNDENDIYNHLTLRELRAMIIEFKLKIPYYMKLKKKELIEKIIALK